MHNAVLVTGQTKSGGWKAFVLGYTERFGNKRMFTLEDQPHRGFRTRELAIAHAKAKAPTREALVVLAATAINGQFISQERQLDMKMEEVELPGAAPTGPVMPLVGLRAPAPAPVPGADSEEQIVQDAARELEADPSMEGRLRVSVEMATRTKKLRRTREAEAAHARQIAATPVSDQDAQMQQGIRKFANAGELLIQYLVHGHRIQALQKEQTTLWGALLVEFGTEEKARAMVEQAQNIGASWGDEATAAPPA